MKFYFFPTFRKITVGGSVNQLIEKFWPYMLKDDTSMTFNLFFSVLQEFGRISLEFIKKGSNTKVYQSAARKKYFILFACWVVFNVFFFFFKTNFFKNIFRNFIRVSNSFDPDQVYQQMEKSHPYSRGRAMANLTY